MPEGVSETQVCRRRLVLALRFRICPEGPGISKARVDAVTDAYKTLQSVEDEAVKPVNVMAVTVRLLGVSLSLATVVFASLLGQGRMLAVQELRQLLSPRASSPTAKQATWPSRLLSLSQLTHSAGIGMDGAHLGCT